jgi:hypothetical protein
VTAAEYVTEISVPVFGDGGIQRLCSHMRDPEPLPEPEPEADSPEPGTRRIWTYHDVQCQVPNPRPGPDLDGYPECGWINQHAGDHDYRRHAAEGFIRPREPELEPEAGL